MAVFSAISSAIGANAADDAKDAQVTAASDSIAEQRRQFDVTQKNLKPFLETGTAANKQLAYLLGIGSNQAAGATDMGAQGSLSKSFGMEDFEQDPGYAFRLAEGQKALDRTSAAQGKYFSGQAIKGLQRYNQDMAANEYQNAYNRYNTNQTNLYNRLAGVSGTGQTTANQLGQFGANVANQISSAYGDIGNAQAAGSIAQGNAWQTGLNNAAGNIGFLAGYKGWI